MAINGRAIRACLGVLASAIAFAIFAQDLQADDYARVNLPIPVEIESRQVRAPFYLGLDLRMIHLPFRQFALTAGAKAGVKDNDPADKLFVTAIKAAQAGDASQFASVWGAPNEMKSAGATTIAMAGDNGPDAWMKMIRANSDLNHLEIVTEARVGSGRVFIFDSKIQGQPLRSAFYVGPDRNGHSKVTAVSSSTTVPALILNCFQAAQTKPQLYDPLAAVNTAYRMSLPVDGAAQADTGSVMLEFNGSFQPPAPIVQLFRDANEAYKKGDFKTVESYFTAGSQRRVNPWLEKLAAGNSVRTPSILPPVEHIQFVLTADPVYIVFSAPPPMPGISPEWSYQFVIQEDGVYKLANFSYSGTLDDLLQNKDLFTKQHLREAR